MGRETAFCQTKQKLMDKPSPTDPPAINPLPLTITITRVVNLSHLIDPKIPQWPGDPPVEFETVGKLENDGYYLRRFSLGEHSATHMNAPNSFYPQGMSIDQYPAESLVAKAVVIDIRDRAEANPNYAI